MPLLQSIVAEFDRELTRLHAIRTIVAGLSKTPALVSRYTFPAPQPAAPVAEPKRALRPRLNAGWPRGPRRVKTMAPEPRALAATVPSGPVVFNPGRLAAERARRKESREAEAVSEPTAPPDLDALSRDLAARWTTGAVQ